MALNLEALAGAILGAVKPVLKKHWKDAKNYAETESRKMAQTLENIARLLAEGKITRQQAEILVEMQANSMRAVFLTVEGIGVIAAQKAINAAVDAVRDTVNGAVGFSLL
jgi:predicted ATP-grasp superfamily ATP-dependent carboligase